MKKSLSLVVFMLGICALLNSFAWAYPLGLRGQELGTYLDSLDVANNWLPHKNANWYTGHTLGTHNQPKITHCSAFVAAATAKLGIYILRPPATLLARAQSKWLRDKGPDFGWFPVLDDFAAQKIANEGCMVVMAYDTPNRRDPGHVAIVRPSTKSTGEIRWRGPQIIQAGGKNYNSANLSKGIRNHHSALRKKIMAYYGHSTPFCRLLVDKS